MLLPTDVVDATSTGANWENLDPLGTMPIFLHFLLSRLLCVEPLHEMDTHLPTYTLYAVMHGPFTTTSLERHSGNEPSS